MSEFLTIGEPMALFAAQDKDIKLKDATHFQKFLAGAEVNVAVGVSRLGHSVEYITQLGADPMGDYIKDELNKNNIGTNYISTTPDYLTGFQMKEKVTVGDPDTFYFRRGSAASHLEASALDKIDFSDIKLAHLTGIFPGTSETALATFKHLAALLKEHHIKTTFDPNLRPTLWESQEKMVTTINELAAKAEIILPGIHEGEILMGSRDPEAIADFFLANGENTQTVVVKLGAHGAFVKSKNGETCSIPGYKVSQVVDTVGAGDGFAAGFITGQLEGLSIEASALRGNAVGSFAVQAPGDNDGYPEPAELQSFMAAYARL
ncbi:sugar kinase [Lactiplantibacillus mudanjiangensis]|uniref:2-dehydro-3-deoxygluconokinase [Lactobacillus sp.] n=1 Tax=Lactiplantibacillus mudanjiangensis TaxID=1296538 RepID=A0A660E4F7_9LACO|nr:sugar kinase [Lactiplantibacillus mudanjiangensis]VDG22575.1 2-dehydro-3-deoxygluconokinase [Lactobacillus sp.] [Lactiplantibacillus mudanjiangensis]VDG26889.1 2-dehydro-3-deoxygluconokinase [Lactobacillus sp.] [Lactiplantibacillus mudanjiangensis]